MFGVAVSFVRMMRDQRYGTMLPPAFDLVVSRSLSIGRALRSIDLAFNVDVGASLSASDLLLTNVAMDRLSLRATVR